MDWHCQKDESDSLSESKFPNAANKRWVRRRYQVRTPVTKLGRVPCIRCGAEGQEGARQALPTSLSPRASKAAATALRGSPQRSLLNPFLAGRFDKATTTT
jgi:hypothetical protein